MTPAGAYALFARPMHELAGLTVDLEDVAGSAAAELAEECHAAPSGRTMRQEPPLRLDRRAGLPAATRLDPAVGWMLDADPSA